MLRMGGQHHGRWRDRGRGSGRRRSGDCPCGEARSSSGTTCGYRTALHMKEYEDKRPMVVIGGSSQDFLGEYMAGGIVILLGLGEIPHSGNFIGHGHAWGRDLPARNLGGYPGGQRGGHLPPGRGRPEDCGEGRGRVPGALSRAWRLRRRRLWRRSSSGSRLSPRGPMGSFMPTRYFAPTRYHAPIKYRLRLPKIG